jgi:autotransporter-associated beta strand protein
MRKTSRIRRIHFTLALGAVTSLMAMAAPTDAAVYYLDVNGALAGSGITNGGSYNWTGSNLWSTDANGAAGLTNPFTGGTHTAVFSADTDAAGDAYTIQLQGTTWIGGLTVEEGNLTIDVNNKNFVMNGSTTLWTILDGTSVATSGTGSGSWGAVNLNNKATTFDVQGSATATIAGMGNSGSASVTKNGAGTLLITGSASGSTHYGGATFVNDGVIRISNDNALGATGTSTQYTLIKGNTQDGRVELTGNITTGESFRIEGRQGTATNLASLSNFSGNNTVTAQVTGFTGGTHYNIESQAGLLTLSGGITQVSGTATRLWKLMGAGDGLVDGVISNGTAGFFDLQKMGTGTWTLSNTNTYNGKTTVSEGVLDVTGSLANNGSDKIFITKDANDNFNSGAAPELQRAVAGLTDLTGFGATEVGGLNTIASILAGSTNSATVIDMAFRGRNNAIVAGETSLLSSDVLRLEGLDGIVFVLQMSYDPAAALANGQAETTLRLGYLNTALNRWEDAVLGNHGTNTGSFFLSSYLDAGSPLDLGSFGVDVVNNVVWAVLDHNSFFAVIPTPGALPAGALLMGLVVAAKRRRQA